MWNNSCTFAAEITKTTKRDEKTVLNGFHVLHGIGRDG